MHTAMIMAAANTINVATPEGRTHTLVVVDNCHFGRNMQAIFKLLREVGCEVDAKCVGMEDRGQGFINQNGSFLNRSESYLIAKKSGQPYNDQHTLPNNKLDSSCIRHFTEKLDDEVYHEEGVVCVI